MVAERRDKNLALGFFVGCATDSWVTPPRFSLGLDALTASGRVAAKRNCPNRGPQFIVWILFTQATDLPIRKYRRIKGQQAFLVSFSVHVSLRWRRELPCLAALAGYMPYGLLPAGLDAVDGLRRNSSPSSRANNFDLCERPWTRAWSENTILSANGLAVPVLELRS